MKSKVIFALTACFLGWGLQSCTPFEEGAAIGAVAGGIIGSHISEGHRHYRRCYHCYSYDGTSAYATEDSTDENVRVARKYNIPVQTAQMIVASIHRAQSQDHTALTDWGLTESDVASIYNNKELSDKAIQNVSSKLGFEKNETQDLVADMTADIQAEKTRLNLQ